MDAPELAPEEIRDLIDRFEREGYIVFRIEADRARFSALADYVSQRMVPIWTDVDAEAGTVTFALRPRGSI